MLARHKNLNTRLIIVILALFGYNLSTSSAQDSSIGLLTIPSINVNAQIVNAPLAERTWDVSHLYMNVGHFQHTAGLGQSGNTVLGGHSLDSSLNPDIFYNLHHVQPNDVITITVNDTIHNYLVITQTVIDYTDTSILTPINDAQLTIITCDASSHNGSGFYQRRIVVIAVKQ